MLRFARRQRTALVTRRLPLRAMPAASGGSRRSPFRKTATSVFAAEQRLQRNQPLRKQSMRKPLPETMFNDPERSRLTMLRAWVLDNDVTEIEMKERQFWNFAHLQPLAEKPWTTFMGRAICVPDMPLDAQKHLGVFDKRTLAAI